MTTMPTKRFYIVCAEFDPAMTKADAYEAVKEEIKSSSAWWNSRTRDPSDPQKFTIKSVNTVSHLP